jgi:hypothetical protein
MLKEAKDKLQGTSTGISEDYFSHCHAFLIHGTGQGSGNSPASQLVHPQLYSVQMP